MQRSYVSFANLVRILTVAVPLAVVLFSEMSWTGNGLAVASLLVVMGVAIAIGIAVGGNQAARTLAQLEGHSDEVSLPATSKPTAIKLVGVLVFLASLAMEVSVSQPLHGGPQFGLRGYELAYNSLMLAGDGRAMALPILIGVFFLLAAPWVDFRRTDARPDWRRILLASGWVGLFSIPILMWMGAWMRLGGWFWAAASVTTLMGAWCERLMASHPETSHASRL